VLPTISGNTPVSPQDVYCNNQDIGPINSSDPSGGDGVYLYQWESRIGTGEWVTDVATKEYPTTALPSDGTSPQIYQFRRIVFSGLNNTCEDLSPVVEITVLPDIENNEIAVVQDTICADLPTITLTGSAPSGGDGDPYTYAWETSPDGVDSWTAGPGTNDQSYYQPGSLSESLFFRRVVTDGENGVCSNISNIQEIIVLPSISGNLLSEDQEQCEGEIPEILTGGIPSGGNGSFDYQWQGKIGDEGNWQVVSGQDQDFNPPQLDNAGDYFYRRLVFSGENNTCADTSSQVQIAVEAQISNNIADAIDLEACFESEATIGAAAAQGGDGLTPSYIWQDSISGSSWSNAEGTINTEDYVEQSLEQTT
jgi:hypothetical protein